MPRLSARRQRLAIKIGSVLVLLLAVMPQVLYLGSPLSADDSAAAARTAPPGHERHAKAAAEHANHCHVGPKGCAASDGVASVASFPSVIELLAHVRSISAIDTEEPLRSFALWQRPDKPPQIV